MIVGIHQPNYLPGVSYFTKILQSDVFILLDTVQFSKGNWTNRNRIKSPHGEIMLTVPISIKGQSFQKISEININMNEPNWRKKHLKTLEQYYSKGNYYHQYLSLLKDIYSQDWKLLSIMNIWIIKEICSLLNIQKEIICATDLTSTDLSATDLLIFLTKEVGGDSYLSGQGGRKYLEVEKFLASGVKLVYAKFTAAPYPQLYGGFIPNLSVVDLLLNEGPNAIEILNNSGTVEE
jgi:hypothetical protein